MRLPALVEQRQTHLFPVVVSTVPVQHYHRAVLRPESHNKGSSGVLNRYGSNEARGVSRTRRRRVIGPSRTGACVIDHSNKTKFNLASSLVAGYAATTWTLRHDDGFWRTGVSQFSAAISMAMGDCCCRRMLERMWRFRYNSFLTDKGPVCPRRVSAN